MSRVDKRGQKYWKVREFYESESTGPTNSSSLSPKELELLNSYQEKVKANYKMEDFSKAEIDAYCK